MEVAAPAPSRHRLARFAALAASAGILVVGAAYVSIGLPIQIEYADVVVGMDLRFYVERTASWIAGDGFYLPWQLTGEPYVVERWAALYPPPAVLLLLPFTLGAPSILWWAIPVGTIVAVLVRRGVAWWAWPVLAFAVAWPRTYTMVLVGNPGLWVVAGAVAGLHLGWPAVLALLKPALAPLVLAGSLAGRTRAWLAALAVAAAAAIPFGPMWADYLVVLANARTERSIEYVLGEWPTALALLVVASSRRRPVLPALPRRRASPPGGAGAPPGARDGGPRDRA